MRVIDVSIVRKWGLKISKLVAGKCNRIDRNAFVSFWVRAFGV